MYNEKKFSETLLQTHSVLRICNGSVDSYHSESDYERIFKQKADTLIVCWVSIKKSRVLQFKIQQKHMFQMNFG